MTSNLVHFAPGLPGLPEELLLARDRGEVLFVTGSGTSRPAPTNLPDFQGLVLGIYLELDPTVGNAFRAALEYRCHGKDPLRRLQKTPNKFGTLDAGQSAELYRCLSGDYDIALGMLERRVDGTADNNSQVRTIARELLASAKTPNALHRALRVLGQRYDQPFLASTNYDPMLEHVRPRVAPRKCYGLNSLPRPSRRRDFNGIYHIHGVLPSRPTDTAEMILTDQDFGDYYLRRRTTADFIYDATRIYHLVLVGYSLSDAPMRYLLNAVAGDEDHFSDIKARYAFIPVTGVDERAVADWRKRNIIPIPYDDADGHRQLAELLTAWADNVPKTGDIARTIKRLRIISRNPPSSVPPEDLTVFRYLFRRSNKDQRRIIIGELADAGASFEWLSIMTGIMQERR